MIFPSRCVQSKRTASPAPFVPGRAFVAAAKFAATMTMCSRALCRLSTVWPVSNSEFIIGNAHFNWFWLLLDNIATPKMNEKCPSLPNLEAKRAPEYTTSLSYTPTTKYFEDFTIAIDWDPTALHLRYQSTLERVSRQPHRKSRIYILNCFYSRSALGGS